ncbi:PEGA domain-containing protein [Nesterenkonia alkaliphila]|uniref:PEGA domain-containing protein n=1 Tax=Nesterenkonia alkaliphila TaxID=1463631 RepID=A0A7K1UIE2_9MICC|nr:PEGA domain-containing protein [Nesterenkonia alkaliphila]MVT26243.1 hypothetical protein [Nesterenkonia alkaliphila]GFZ99471.1 hypothetical protein GCM10011359_30560 [Nesterenkonia alkaliphila]
MSKHANTIVLTLFFLLVAGVLTVGAYFLFFRPSAEYQVQITTLPEDVLVYFDNGDPIGHTDTATYTLEDSTVTIRVERLHFDAYEHTHQLSPERVTELDIELVPNSPLGEEIRMDDDYFAGQAQATDDYWDELQNLQANNPIYDQLPEEQELFQAYYGISQEDNDMAVHLVLDAEDPEPGREAFNTWMEEIGEDPADHEIIEHLE